MYATRANESRLISSLVSHWVTAIIGPRRVGKSTMVSHVQSMNPERDWVSLNMDNLLDREAVEGGKLADTIIRKANRKIQPGRKLWVTIDEAQKAPWLFDQIKVIYDTFKDQNAIKFILTGSAVLSLHQLSAESLAGRIDILYEHAFNLSEAALLLGHHVPKVSVLDAIASGDLPALQEAIESLYPYQDTLSSVLQELLLWGGLPEQLLLSQHEEKIVYLSNYLQTYLEKDVRALRSISDLPLYRRMLDIISETTGSVRDNKRIYGALQCKSETLEKYRGVLSATLLYDELYPYIYTTLKRLTKSPKGYLLNNGLLSVLTGIDSLSHLTQTGLIGHRLENWFYNELKVWSARMIKPAKQYYWRTSSGAEVDFIQVIKPAVFPFEVTYSQKIERKKLRNLVTFLREEPRAQWGYYVYRGEFQIDTENRVVYLPAWSIG